MIVSVTPILLAIAGAVVLWVARERSSRWAWAIASGAAVILWAATLLLASGIPSTTSISVWRPSELFTAGLELVLDNVGWRYSYLIASILAAASLTGAARSSAAFPQMKAAAFLYASLGMLAVLAGNLITVILAWALLDAATFAFQYLASPQDRPTTRFAVRLGVDTAGLLLLILAGLLNGSEGSEANFEGGAWSLSATLLILTACLLRLGLLPLHFSFPSVPGLSRGMSVLLRLVPPGVALALLSKLFRAGAASDLSVWLIIIGGVGGIAGGIRWALRPGSSEELSSFILGVSGVAILAAGVNPGMAGASVLSGGTSLLLVGSVLSLGRIHTPWHRAALLLAALLLAGLPLTPSHELAVALSSQVLQNGALWASVLGVFVLASLVTGAVQQTFIPIESWEAGEELARLSYALGAFLPVLVGFGVALQSVSATTLAGAIFSLLLLSLAGLFLFLFSRLPSEAAGRLQRLTIWLELGPIYRAAGNVYASFLGLIRSVSEIIEGEAAILWILVFMLLLGLGVVRG